MHVVEMLLHWQLDQNNCFIYWNKKGICNSEIVILLFYMIVFKCMCVCMLKKTITVSLKINVTGTKSELRIVLMWF